MQTAERVADAFAPVNSLAVLLKADRGATRSASACGSSKPNGARFYAASAM
jgi:hypothetical protein